MQRLYQAAQSAAAAGPVAESATKSGEGIGDGTESKRDLTAGAPAAARSVTASKSKDEWYRQYVEQFLATPPATLRHLWVRAQAGVHEMRVYSGAGDCLYQANWLRDGSYPTAPYGHFSEPKLYLAQLMSNVVQAFDLSLHMYVADMQALVADPVLAAQVRWHPHISWSSLLSPTLQDGLARLLCCGAFQDDNARMVIELRQAVLLLQKILLGQVTLRDDHEEGLMPDDVPIGPAVLERLKTWHGIQARGLVVNGMPLYPTVDFNNFAINELRAENWVWTRVKLSGAMGLARLDSDLAAQPIGCRASVVGFANALGDFLALNQAHPETRRFLIVGQVKYLQAIRTFLRRLTTRYAEDIRAVSIEDLQVLHRQVEELRQLFTDEQCKQSLIQNLRLRLQAAVRYLFTLNQHVVENDGLNRSLMAASFERIMHKTLGNCKSSSDRFGLQESNMDACLLYYQETDQLPSYSNHYYWPCQPFRTQLVDLKEDLAHAGFGQDAWLKHFIQCVQYQFRVRHLTGAAAGTGLKSIKRIVHPASWQYFRKAGMDFKAIQRVANGVKAKAKLLPTGARVELKAVDKSIPIAHQVAVAEVATSSTDATTLARWAPKFRPVHDGFFKRVESLRQQLVDHESERGGDKVFLNMPGSIDEPAFMARVLLPLPQDFTAEDSAEFERVLTAITQRGVVFEQVLDKLKLPAALADFKASYLRLMHAQVPVEWRSYFSSLETAEALDIWWDRVQPHAQELLGVSLFGAIADRSVLSIQLWRHKGTLLTLGSVSAVVGYALYLGFATHGDFWDPQNHLAALRLAGMLVGEMYGLAGLWSVHSTMVSAVAFKAYMQSHRQLPRWQLSGRGTDALPKVAQAFLVDNTGDTALASRVVRETGRSICAQTCDRMAMNAMLLLKTLIALVIVPGSAFAVWMFFPVLYACMGEPEHRPDPSLYWPGTACFFAAGGFVLYQMQAARNSVVRTAGDMERLTAAQAPFSLGVD